MTVHFKAGGAWVTPSSGMKIHVKDAGTWKEVQNAYIKEGGVWTQFFQNARVTLSVTSIGDLEGFPTSATATLTMLTDGTQTTTGNTSNASGNWFTPTTSSIGNSYWVRLNINSGSAPNSGTTGSWIQLSTNRSWTWTRASIGTIIAGCTLQVATDSGGSNIVGTDTFNVNVEMA